MDDINKKIEEIANYIIKNYGISKNFLNNKELYIHDNVFGTLKFTNFERKIINSPFLQRLTKISQMGLANFVYPGAVHNRFSHSLGVSYLAEKIYEEIMGDSDERSDEDKIKDINTIKLAGLLHDIGHGPFSHLTENVISRLRSHSYKCKGIDEQIVVRSGGSGQTSAKEHEYLAFHLINSKPIIKLIKNIYIDSDVPIHLDLIPLCITNNSLPGIDDEGKFSKIFKDKFKMFLIKIINSYSDADKIDYLLRDSKFSGLPIPADTDRLISFLTRIEDEDTGNYELGVSEKGTRAFNLLLQSRAKMFPTVYYHHTTLACEAILSFAIVEAIRNVSKATIPINDVDWPLIECGVDLLKYTDDKLLEYLRIIDNPITKDVVLRLNNRRHYRVVRQFYTWELKNRIVKSEEEYQKELIENGEYEEFNVLLEEERYIEHEMKLTMQYKKDYEPQQLFKIYKFLFLFEGEAEVSLNSIPYPSYDKILNFKKDILQKDNSIIEDLEVEFPNVERDTLIDYVLALIIPKKRNVSEPYTQEFIKRYNHITEKEELLSLSKMGYDIPKELDYQQLIFFALPEYMDKIRPLIDNYARKIIPEFFIENNNKS